MDWLQRAAASRPGAPAIITPDRTYSYAELDRAADAVAGIINSSDLRGGAVAFWGERAPATVAVVWGIPRAGSVAVAIDPGLPPAEAMRLTREAGAVGLWPIEPGGMEMLLKRGEGRRKEGAREEGARREVAREEGARKEGAREEGAREEGAREEGAREEGAREEGARGEEGTAPRYIVFTSGTSGRRKGVILTGANIAAAVEGSQQRLGNGPDDPWLTVLPLHHVGGLAILWRQAAAGAPVVLHSTFDPVAAVAALQKVTYASLVPTMLHRLLAAGAGGRTELRGVLVGGGPGDSGLMRVALDAGLPVLATYGMTETCSQVCTVAPGEAEHDLGTAGRPIPGAEVAIGEDGRIRVRGAMVSPGYASEAPRQGEWFVTGDRGRIDEMGRLIVLGRADAVIVTGGENVDPTAVERALGGITGVVAVRVLGEPDAEWGSRVVAELVLDSGAELPAIVSAARRLLAAHEVPRDWRLVAEVHPPKLM